MTCDKLAGLLAPVINKRAKRILPVFEKNIIGAVASALGKLLGNNRRRPHHRRQLHAAPSSRIVVGRMRV